MSTLKQAITSLKGKIADAYTVAQTKGATMPATQDTAHLAAAIASIQTGGFSTRNIYLINGVQMAGVIASDTYGLPITDATASNTITEIDCSGTLFWTAGNSRVTLGDMSAFTSLQTIKGAHFDLTATAKLAASNSSYVDMNFCVITLASSVTSIDFSIKGWKAGDYALGKSTHSIAKYLNDNDRVIVNAYQNTVAITAPSVTTIIGDMTASEVIANNYKCFDTLYPAAPTGSVANRLFKNLTLLERPSIVSIFLSLGDASARIAAGDWMQGAFTLTLPTTWANRVTDDDKAIATGKGWVLNFTA